MYIEWSFQSANVIKPFPFYMSPTFHIASSAPTFQLALTVSTRLTYQQFHKTPCFVSSLSHQTGKYSCPICPFTSWLSFTSYLLHILQNSVLAWLSLESFTALSTQCYFCEPLPNSRPDMCFLEHSSYYLYFIFASFTTWWVIQV